MLPIQKSNLLVLGVAAIVAGSFLGGPGGDGPRPARGAPPPDNPPDVKPVVPIPFPDGVLDTERRTAFVSTPKGGIQAVRLEDGKVLWTNDNVTARPWLVAGSRLVACGER